MRRLAILGVAALTTFGLVGTSCSSSKTTTPASGTGGNAAAGTSSTAGTSATTGGSTSTGSSTGGLAATGGSPATGTGGSTSTTGGAAAAGSSAIGCSSTNTMTAPTNGVIADFVGTAADAGIEILGGLSVYPKGSSSAPTAAINGGALNITENAAATTAAQYVGAVLYFNDCVDASAFTGVEFTLSGSVSGCTVQYSTNYSGADDETTDPKGSCTLGSGNCYSPQTTLTAAQITTAGTTIQVPWATTGGAPSGPVNKAQLTGIQWQFTIASGTGTCTASLSITNVKFY